jgi:hypothetical protein
VGGQVLTKALRRFCALATGFVHGGFRDLHIDDSGFDETAPFECVHRMNP